MIYPAILFDLAPVSSGSGVGIFLAVAFLFVFLAVAFIVFKLLKKTVKMAFRLMIVGVILAIAVAGSFSFWWLGSSKSTRPERQRPTQSK